MALGLSVLGCAPPSGFAGENLPSRQDIQVIGRILKFLEGRKNDSLRIAIVYDQAQPSSAGEAVAFARLINTNPQVGDLALNAQAVEEDDVGAMGSVDAVFIVASDDRSRILDVLRRHAIPCITRDIQKVASGACTIGLQTSPNVSIYYSSANANQVGVRFATAFVMMVHDL